MVYKSLAVSSPPSFPFAPLSEGYSTVLEEQVHLLFFGRTFPEVLLIAQHAVGSVGLTLPVP